MPRQPRARACEIIFSLGGKRGLRDKRVMRAYIGARKFDRGWVKGFGYAGKLSGLMAALSAAGLGSNGPGPDAA